MKKLLLVLLILTANFTIAQYHDVQFPNADRAEKCNYYSQLFQQKPREVNFAIQRTGNKLYFEINDRKWFNKLIKNSGDGIAIDLVPKTLYDCSLKTIAKQQVKGMLLKPVYAKKLKSGLKPKGNNRFSVFVGTIPTGLQNDELEYNILFISNKNLCQYYAMYNLAAYPWDLLDMGMYLDSLTYKSKKIKPINKDGYTTKYKTLNFTIPFQKNKAEYSSADIKPLYDSLRLTDFNIKKIDIKAYSSVEGSLERNTKLQEQRANSIAEALQSFQSPTIVTNISSSENWVEFLNDVSQTKFEDLKSLSKKKIKTKLTGATVKELEKFLKNHRKAVITLELEKKDKYKNKSTEELVALFNKVLAQENIEVAKDIQNSIFNKLKETQSSPDILDKMSIPRQKKYAMFINKNSVNKFLLNQSYLLIAHNELKQLEKTNPKDFKIKYNLVALKFNIWRYNAEPVNEKSFKNEILALKKHGIKQPLIDRMLVNYHIIRAEQEMRNRNYKTKDASVLYILNHYKKFNLSNYDYLSLAQFLTYYYNTEESVKLLDEKARSINISEDLLFYYLNLTLVNPEFTQKLGYRTIMLNAININKERFCKLFNSPSKGGVTFQLLEDNFLRDTYCENCNN